MPRYFFDTIDNSDRTVDRHGLDCKDLEAVRQQAMATLPHMAFDGLPDGDQHEFAIEVRDDDGVPIFRATLAYRSEWLKRT